MHISNESSYEGNFKFQFKISVNYAYMTMKLKLLVFRVFSQDTIARWRTTLFGNRKIQVKPEVVKRFC